MRKVTYTNLVNGLSVEFSSEDPLTHLDLKNFDGSSVGANAVTYSPVGTDGQHTVSVNLPARTITLPVEVAGRAGGKYSREKALERVNKILQCFVPLHDGVLKWTDGKRTRTINCRTAETPKFSAMLPFLFSTTISLTADYPYWEDTAEHSVELGNGRAITITNNCGVAVPFCLDVPANSTAPIIYSYTADAVIWFDILPEKACTIDTKACTVTLSDGTFANHLLDPMSSFFKLLPGENVFDVLEWLGDDTKAVIRWKDLYLGVD